jgi:hypothetical protein
MRAASEAAATAAHALLLRQAWTPACTRAMHATQHGRGASGGPSSDAEASPPPHVDTGGMRGALSAVEELYLNAAPLPLPLPQATQAQTARGGEDAHAPSLGGVVAAELPWLPGVLPAVGGGSGSGVGESGADGGSLTPAAAAAALWASPLAQARLRGALRFCERHTAVGTHERPVLGCAPPFHVDVCRRWPISGYQDCTGGGDPVSPPPRGAMLARWAPRYVTAVAVAATHLRCAGSSACALAAGEGEAPPVPGDVERGACLCRPRLLQ